jgi:Tn3 transposase DDE domain
VSLKAITIFGTVTLAFVGSPHARVAGLPYTELRRQGGTINDDLLRHVAPLGWEHTGLTGDYVWSTADQPPAGTLRPLRQRQSLLAA